MNFSLRCFCIAFVSLTFFANFKPEKQYIYLYIYIYIPIYIYLYIYIYIPIYIYIISRNLLFANSINWFKARFKLKEMKLYMKVHQHIYSMHILCIPLQTNFSYFSPNNTRQVKDEVWLMEKRKSVELFLWYRYIATW